MRIPLLILLLTTIVAGCSQDAETAGVVYSGQANLSNQLHEFTAINTDTEKSMILTRTGPRELTFNFNDNVSHIDYEKDEIIIRSEADELEWSVTKTKDGFQLEDGTVLEYGDCDGWIICILDSETKEPILKGKYSSGGNTVIITLWMSEKEKHVELLGLVTNALFNKSKHVEQSIQSALETLSAQVWTF